MDTELLTVGISGLTLVGLEDGLLQFRFTLTSRSMPSILSKSLSSPALCFLPPRDSLTAANGNSPRILQKKSSTNISLEPPSTTIPPFVVLLPMSSEANDNSSNLWLSTSPSTPLLRRNSSFTSLSSNRSAPIPIPHEDSEGNENELDEATLDNIQARDDRLYLRIARSKERLHHSLSSGKISRSQGSFGSLSNAIAKARALSSPSRHEVASYYTTSPPPSPTTKEGDYDWYEETEEDENYHLTSKAALAGLDKQIDSVDTEEEGVFVLDA